MLAAEKPTKAEPERLDAAPGSAGQPVAACVACMLDGCQVPFSLIGCRLGPKTLDVKPLQVGAACAPSSGLPGGAPPGGAGGDGAPGALHPAGLVGMVHQGRPPLACHRFAPAVLGFDHPKLQPHLHRYGDQTWRWHTASEL